MPIAGLYRPALCVGGAVDRIILAAAQTVCDAAEVRLDSHRKLISRTGSCSADRPSFARKTKKRNKPFQPELYLKNSSSMSPWENCLSDAARSLH
jgi:hypothetical protein